VRRAKDSFISWIK